MIKIEEPENVKHYAIVQDGVVTNVVVWDGETPYNPDGELVEIPEGSTAGIDWDYIDGEFVDNRPVPEIGAL
jgi:hypothetical protein